MTVARLARLIAVTMLSLEPLAVAAQGASKLPRVTIFTLGFSPDSGPVQAQAKAETEAPAPA